jgi:adenylate cyclase
LRECLIRAPADPNCLLISAAVQSAAGELKAAQETMGRLLKADPGFSLAEERTYRRFGDSPLMDQFLTQLANARAPEIKSSGMIDPAASGSSLN